MKKKYFLLSVLSFFVSFLILFDSLVSAHEGHEHMDTLGLGGEDSICTKIQECAEQKFNCSKCEEYLISKRDEASSQVKTLSSQIAVMNSQIRLTELRIESNRQQITDLTLDIDTADKKIDNLQSSLENLSVVLVNRIKSTYVVGAEDPFHVLLSSSDASNFFKRLNYLRIAQQHDRRLIVETTAAKNDYENQKDILEDKKNAVETLRQELERYTAQLAQEKKDKDGLLVATRNDETRYQALLSQAQAERAIVFGGGTETFMREVSQGDSIGSIAPWSVSPGCSGGDHLHFEVHKGNSVQDPNNYLRPGGYTYSSNYDQSYYGSVYPSGDWSWPLNEPALITQGYGSHPFAQNSGFYPVTKAHQGIDMYHSSRTVKAVKSGKLYGGSYNCSQGKLYYAKIQHDEGIVAWYLHIIPN